MKEEIVVKRISKNKQLFNKKELKILKKNVNIVKKIYLLGLLDGRAIYK